MTEYPHLCHLLLSSKWHRPEAPTYNFTVSCCAGISGTKSPYKLKFNIYLQPFSSCPHSSPSKSNLFQLHHQEGIPLVQHPSPDHQLARSLPSPKQTLVWKSTDRQKVERGSQGSVRWRSHEGHRSLGG